MAGNGGAGAEGVKEEKARQARRGEGDGESRVPAAGGGQEGTRASGPLKEAPQRPQGGGQARSAAGRRHQQHQQPGGAEEEP